MHQTALWSLPLFSSKGVELLVCELLLTLRTSLWQRGGSSNGEPGPAPGPQLAGFQRDLSALRKLTQCYRQAQHKVHEWRGHKSGVLGNWQKITAAQVHLLIPARNRFDIMKCGRFTILNLTTVFLWLANKQDLSPEVFVEFFKNNLAI